MFDTMTMVKTFGALCGALLVFLLGGWFAETVYHAGGGHGHGEGEHAQGYMIETSDAGGDAEPAAEVAFADVLAAADPAKGEKIFKKCSACHSIEDGANGVGPNLHNVVGRAAGSVSGFSYSGAFDGVVETWDPEHLNGFLTKPASYAAGTTMGFAGLPKIEDRAAVVAYLQSQGG